MLLAKIDQNYSGNHLIHHIIAENLQHLILSTRMTNLAYRLPKLLVRIIGGKPNRTSIGFEELMKKYYSKLAQGATASSRFVPKPIKINCTKEKLLDNWNKVTVSFLRAVRKNRTESDLDNYIAGHPLLGKITLRELCYFTIFHTQHHTLSITKIALPRNDSIL